MNAFVRSDVIVCAGCAKDHDMRWDPKLYAEIWLPPRVQCASCGEGLHRADIVEGACCIYCGSDKLVEVPPAKLKIEEM